MKEVVKIGEKEKEGGGFSTNIGRGGERRRRRKKKEEKEEDDE